MSATSFGSSGKFWDLSLATVLAVRENFMSLLPSTSSSIDCGALSPNRGSSFNTRVKPPGLEAYLVANSLNSLLMVVLGDCINKFEG